MVKICPICRQQFPTKAALAAHMGTHRGQAAGGRRRRQRGAGAQNGTTLALKEYWGTTSQGINEIKLKPSASKLTKLAQLAPLYETYKLVSFVVHFVHTAASSESGSYFAGVSYQSTRHPTDGKGVAGLSPSICKALTSDSSISVPCSKVMGTPWLHYSDPNPGSVMVYVDSAKALNVYVTYNVRFVGPTTVSQDALDTFYTFDRTSWKDEQGNVVRSLADDGEAYGELELLVSEGSMDTVWDRLAQVYTTWTRIHHTWVQTLGVIHFLSSAFNGVLPSIGVPAVLHLQRRPFRTDSERFRLLVRNGGLTRADFPTGSRDSGIGT